MNVMNLNLDISRLNGNYDCYKKLISIKIAICHFNMLIMSNLLQNDIIFELLIPRLDKSLIEKGKFEVLIITIFLPFFSKTYLLFYSTTYDLLHFKFHLWCLLLFDSVWKPKYKIKVKWVCFVINSCKLIFSNVYFIYHRMILNYPTFVWNVSILWHWWKNGLPKMT